MEFEYTYYIQIFIGLISVMSPLSSIPVFLSLTEKHSKQERQRVAKRASYGVMWILIIAALAGEAILGFFGIDISSFQIAGGILILLMSLQMLNAKRPPSKFSEVEDEEAHEKEDISIVPLALPLLAGPGTISTVVVYSGSMPFGIEKVILLGILICAAVVIRLTLELAAPIGNRLGQTGLNIVGRIMGLILAAIAVKFILTGLAAYGITKL